MACIKASQYNGTSPILAVYGTGIEDLNQCVEECGICCVPTCTFPAYPTSYDFIENGIYTEEDILPSGTFDSQTVVAACSNVAEAYNAYSSGLYFGVPLAAIELAQGGIIYPGPHPLIGDAVDESLYLFQSGYGFPPPGRVFAGLANNVLLAYKTDVSYEVSKNFANGSSVTLRERFYKKRITYSSCSNSGVTDIKDSIVDYNVTYYWTGSAVPAIGDPGMFTPYLNVPGLDYALLEGNENAQSHNEFEFHVYEAIVYFSGFPGAPSGYLGVDTIPAFPCPSEDGLGCPEFKDFDINPALTGCPLDDTAQTTYTCFDNIGKSGCTIGQEELGPSGVWFSGIDCTIATEAYGGCSGLINM